MRLLLVAGSGVVLWLIGAATLVVSLVGTRRPRGPASRLATAADRVWRGTGRTARVRRRHRALLATGLVAGVLGWLFTGVPVTGLLVAFAVPGAPWLFQVGRAEREAIERVEAVGEWARRLKDVSVTGVGLQQAIVVSAATAPVAIAAEVRDLSVRLHTGVEARDALLRFADAIGDPVCDQVVAALVLHLSDRGDRLGEVLTSIATAASAEVATRREVDAKRTQSRFAVRFLTVTTVGTLAYGAIRPEYMQPYGTPFGEFVMAVLGALFVGILVWTRAMSQPERSPRFLRTPGLDGSRRADLP